MDLLVSNIALALVAVVLTYAIWAVHNRFFTKPRSILKRLKAQGVKGFPFVPFVGQLPEIIKLRQARLRDPAVAASNPPWELLSSGHERHGKLHTFCIGPNVRLSVADPAMARQAYVNLNDVFVKSEFIRAMRLLGDGLITANGDLWTWQRRLINPAFNHREIKRLFRTMVQCSQDAIANLKALTLAEPGKPRNVDLVFSTLTLDIICRCAFGANIDELLGPEVLDVLLVSFTDYLSAVLRTIQFSGVAPWFKYLPLKINRQVWAAEKVIKEAMDKILSVRMEKHRQKMEARAANSSQSGEDEEETTDLLELMMSATEGLEEDVKGLSGGSPIEGNDGSTESPSADGAGDGRSATTGLQEKRAKKLNVDLLKANCITFLLAGHETTGNLLTWTSLLLSQHPDWQEKAREEVNALYDANGGKTPSFEQLNELKVVGWVLNESLRLYPPAAVMGRTASKDVILGEITVPKGTDILIPIVYIHRSKELWGEDAEEFRPDRFANGISKAATHPHAFLPFSLGPRTCIGQNFAMAEAKVFLAMFLRSFSWKLSPTYEHYPDLMITLRAKKGMPMELTALQHETNMQYGRAMTTQD